MAEFHLTISAPRRSAKRWGDWAYAHALARALRGRGHKAQVHCLFELTRRDQIGPDAVVLRIAGPHLEDPVDGAVNLAWIISNPTPCFPRLLAGYQHLFGAGSGLVDSWERLGLRAEFLPQATDPACFHPGQHDPAQREDILFVGGHDPSRVSRRIVHQAIRAGFPVAVWGPGWEGHIPPEHHRGQHLEPEELARAYASARIVLNAHMDDQRLTGIMSNRTMDALASGAAVVSDEVLGADQVLGLPDLHLCRDADALRETLDRLLSTSAPNQQERLARHEAIAAHYSFARSAARIETVAQELLDTGRRADLRPRAASRPAADGPTRPVLMADMAGLIPALHAAGAPGALLADPASTPPPGQDWLLVEHPDSLTSIRGNLHLHLLLSGGRDQPPAIPDAYQAPHAIIDSLHRADLIARQSGGAIALTTYPPGAAPLDHRTALTRLGPPAQLPLHPLSALRDRVTAALVTGRSDPGHDLALIDSLWRRMRTARLAGPRLGDSLLAPELLLRLMQGLPIFPGGPQTRPARWRSQPVRLEPAPPDWPAQDRPLGVFIHLFYDELAPVFADRLAALRTPHRVHISTDSAAKADRIRPYFPDADIRVFENRGRDVWPRFWGFSDAHDAHDIVLHLHGKRSAHSGRLDGWFRHNLDSLIGDADAARSALTILRDLPQTGIIAPPVYDSVRPSVHWTINRAVAEMLAPQLGLDALPDDEALIFPVGSMFWARTDALRPLLDLRLRQSEFAPERGQLDGTLAHAVERLVSIVAQSRGFSTLFLDGRPSGQRDEKLRIWDSTERLGRFLRRRAARRGH